MENHRLKIKIGDAEFEAEGSKESVQAQFEAFKEMLLNVPRAENMPPQSAAEPPVDAPAKNNAQNFDSQLEHIMQHDKRVVSLTAPPGSIDKMVLLLLLGQKVFRNNNAVTGGELTDGLRISGHPINRVDRIMLKLSSDGSVITIGKHRSKRYRLTNRGLAMARDISKEQIELVA